MKTPISPQDADAICRILASQAPKRNEPRCYRIIRFFRNDRKPRTIKNGLSEAEAQAHCSREDMHGPGWFDGWDYMKGVKP